LTWRPSKDRENIGPLSAWVERLVELRDEVGATEDAERATRWFAIPALRAQPGQ
jgi:hypothetical protein